MSLLDSAEKWIAFEEGCRTEAYQDTTGVWTIGIGHTGPEVVPGLVWTSDQIDAAFNNDLANVDADLARMMIDHFDPVRRAALANMDFNLGATKLSKFTTFLSLIRNENWSGARIDLLGSTAWAKELPGRAMRTANAILTGEWPNV